MRDPAKSDPSVFAEPHLRPAKPESAAPIEAPPTPAPADPRASVWDEPAQAHDPKGPTYATWLAEKIASTSGVRTWWVTLALALAAGPWGVFGSLLGGQGSFAGLVTLVVVAPLVEELMKTAAVAVVIETRPYLFKFRSQVLLACVAGGLGFAAIENLLYLNVYIDSPSDFVRQWRWLVCTGLHITCSAVVGLGLSRVWHRTVTDRAPADLNRATPWLIAGVVVHGTYNALAVGMEWGGLFDQ
jgi:hypothetical protein